MKTYPTIGFKPTYGAQVYGFNKLDGSNVRAEWSRKRGLFKFGRRRGLLDDSNPHLVQAPDRIREKYSDDLERAFRKLQLTTAVAFFELHGPRSFAGNHEDARLAVTLLDVATDKKGLLEPRAFLRAFGHMNHPALLFRGKFNRQVERQVKESTLPGMTFEGIVFKGAHISPGRPLMFKVKSTAWLRKLRGICCNEAEFNQRA